jgi:hypothetical protein
MNYALHTCIIGVTIVVWWMQHTPIVTVPWLQKLNNIMIFMCDKCGA